MSADEAKKIVYFGIKSHLIYLIFMIYSNYTTFDKLKKNLTISNSLDYH